VHLHGDAQRLRLVDEGLEVGLRLEELVVAEARAVALDGGEHGLEERPVVVERRL
jgi:hypothetical protein